ncbi:hypothetical protein Tco_0339974 [Tanacetum coccineum]
MTTLKFADTHNMVAFLSKHAESEGFEQIVYFLNAHLIKHALIVNPTIYALCIEQFWATIKAKTVNGEVQLQALVDRKKIVIIESTVSQKLTFYKAFFSQQWKFLIHTILQCPSSKTTTWNEFSNTMASAIICLATNQKFNFSKYIFESMVKNVENVSDEAIYKELDDSLATPNEAGSQGTTSRGGPRCQETMGDTIAQTRVLNLKTTKTTQANEIVILKRRVKKFEQKKRSRNHGLKRLYKVSLTARVESSRDEESLGEDASKQGRINAIDADEDITLVNNQDDADVFDVNTLTGDEELAEQEVAAKDVNLLAASTKVSAATTTTTATILTPRKGIVRILQKSQENGQNRTNTNTGKELSVQEPGECYQRDKRYISPLIGQYPKGNNMRGLKKIHGEKEICTKTYGKEAPHGLPRWQSM